jgi:YjbE family integral membrane protein
LGSFLQSIGLAEITSLLTVVAIDVALAGDNALVVGMAAAGLEHRLRRLAITIGIAAAAILRIVFALFILRLLAIVGLTVAGGLLLLWVAWKLWREIRHRQAEAAGRIALKGGVGEINPPRKTLRQAVTQIVIADLSMSLDNVLAVAGAARDHFWVLVIGLTLSVALMGIAATLVAGLMNRFRWIGYVGVAIVLYVALAMIWEGGHEVFTAVTPLQ